MVSTTQIQLTNKPWRRASCDYDSTAHGRKQSERYSNGYHDEISVSQFVYSQRFTSYLVFRVPILTSSFSANNFLLNHGGSPNEREPFGAMKMSSLKTSADLLYSKLLMILTYPKPIETVIDPEQQWSILQLCLCVRAVACGKDTLWWTHWNSNCFIQRCQETAKL